MDDIIEKVNDEDVASLLWDNDIEKKVIKRRGHYTRNWKKVLHIWKRAVKALEKKKEEDKLIEEQKKKNKVIVSTTQKQINSLQESTSSIIDTLKGIDIASLTYVQRYRVQELVRELTLRKKYFPIMDYSQQPHQQEVQDAVAARQEDWHPKYKYIMFIWWNGSGKTLSSCYIDILIALWKDTQKYNLPYIWEARQILVATKTSDLIKSNLEPYFLWTDGVDDIMKIPKTEIDRIRRDWATQTLKEILLKNWCRILFRTYDAWQARLEWSSSDFVHLDELPERGDIFIELLRGTRKYNAQMLLSFTPTKFNSAVHDYFYSQNSQEVMERTFIRQADSYENKIGVNHLWLEWLSEEERKIRRFWMFVPPTGLVYNEFNRGKNMIPYINPKMLWDVKYYWALDFGVNHPMAFLFIGVDWDWHIYVFDMIYQTKMMLWDLAKAVRLKSAEYWINLEYIVADTADARSRLELKTLHWLNTIPADKFSKWENNLSNRRAWIFKINELLKNRKLLISDKCRPLIKEFETHAYKWNWSEDVIKTDDDALDALRYFIFWYRDVNKKEELIRYLKRKKIRQNIRK